MEGVLQPPQLDDLGLPLVPPAARHGSDEAIMQSIMNMPAGTPEWCQSLGFPPPPSYPSAAEVTSQAQELAKQVLDNWGVLQQILERHEETIRKRWMKKTKTQRRAILLRAWPEMSKNHRPDYEAFRKETPESKSRGTKYREAYLWPSINLEDLSHGRSLLLFLNSRGRHPPRLFAFADSELGRIGRASTAIMPAFLNLHTMYLNGSTVQQYGKLVAWGEDTADEAMMDCMSQLAFQPGEGLLVLEVQQRIMTFLIECCHAILHDVDPKSIISDQYPLKPEPSSIIDPSDFPSLAAMAAEAPYRVPAQIDFNRLHIILSAKKSEAEDHVWALREDPGYFSDAIKEWGEHRQENIPDSKGQLHPSLNTSSFWDHIISSVITDAYGSIIIWDLLCQDLTNLAALQQKYRDKIIPGKRLPEEYVKALLSFRYLLGQSSKGPIETLKTGLPASHPFRSMFIRDPPKFGSSKVILRSKPGVNNDPLTWIFNALWTENTIFLCGLPDLMDELERLVQSEPDQKSRLTAWVANVVADLGVMARAKNELDIYYPWAASFEYEYNEHRELIEKDFPKKLSLLAKIFNIFKEDNLAKLGAPLDGRFHYPSDKRRTRQTTEEMRKAEENLDAFWRATDLNYQKKGGRSLTDSLQTSLDKIRQLERTAEWVEPIKQQKSKALKSNDEVVDSFSQLGISSRPGPSLRAQAPKLKKKTRGDLSSENIDDENVEPAQESRDVQPVFKVSNRAFKVFKFLFHTPSQTDQPGETPWTDFLFAMASTGFMPEKLYGSVWQFTPTKLDVERAIHFHEPHPRAKIPFRIARRIGRRLNRAYGWTGTMFELE